MTLWMISGLAEAWYCNSLLIKNKMGNELEIAKALYQLGRISQDQKRFDEAEAMYNQSLKISERIGDKKGQSFALFQLGTIALSIGQSDEAEALF